MFQTAKPIMVAALLLALIAIPANAGLIDFEQFQPFQNLHGVNLGGVTLYDTVSQSMEVMDDNYAHVSYHSFSKSVIPRDFVDRAHSIAVFDAPQTFVRLWAGNDGTGYVYGWQMEAFDAPVGGNSLGLVYTNDWVGAPYLPLEITAPNIRRIEFGVRNLNLGSGVGFDDLEFSPEPAGIFALLAGLAFFRRRRAGQCSKPILMGISILALASGPVSAGLINFESYPSDQFIDGLNLGGVSITNPYGNHVGVYDNEYGLGYHSASKAISSNDFMRESIRLTATFDSPQTYVRLWAGSAGEGFVDGWLLEAFDSAVGGNSLGIVMADPWAGTPYVPLELNAAGIKRIEFGRTNPQIGSGIGFDDLEFSPEPAGVIALLAGLAFFRRGRAVRRPTGP